ncbi:MAG: phosphotransferase family protein, partial [Alphaproteobacteria bacterium]|nr:phosphotransferase family protein [Alphaproteobacteria bacterium]
MPGFSGLRGARKFPGGQSNPTFLLEADSGEYVLRRKPPGQLLKSAHAVDREYRVMAALAGSGVPVPKVFHLCTDEAVIGSMFYVMEYVRGEVYWDPMLPGLESAARCRLYDEMGRVLAALHTVDVAAVGLGDFARPGQYFERQIKRWTEQYRATETERREDIERLIEWLPANLPVDDGRSGIVHGDFRLDNIVFDREHRAIAVLDWELSTLGHPLADLAYQCAQWRLPVGELRGLAGIDRVALGIPSEESYIEAYRRRTGLPAITHWPFYLAVSLFRLAAICQGVYKRALGG